METTVRHVPPDFATALYSIKNHKDAGKCFIVWIFELNLRLNLVKIHSPC